MAAGNSSRHLGKGGDGESEPRGSARPMSPPSYHRSRVSSRPWGLARARSTSPWHPRTLAQLLESSQPEPAGSRHPHAPGRSLGGGASECPSGLLPRRPRHFSGLRRCASRRRERMLPRLPRPSPSPSSASRVVHARPRPLAGHPSRWPRPPARPEVPVAERRTGPERIAGSG